MLILKPLKTLIKAWGEAGMRLPHAYDAANRVPSARLLYTYISFFIASSSLIALHWHSKLLQATWTAIIFFVICTVLYMLRNLHSFKADLDDKSLEFESEGPDQSTEDKKEKNAE